MQTFLLTYFKVLSEVSINCFVIKKKSDYYFIFQALQGSYAFIKSLSSQTSEIKSVSTSNIHHETIWTLYAKQRKVKHWEHLDVLLPSKLASCWWWKVSRQFVLFSLFCKKKRQKRWRLETRCPFGLKEVSRCAAEKSSALKSHQSRTVHKPKYNINIAVSLWT